MCESEMQGVERGPRGHYLQRLVTIQTEGVNGPQGAAMARGVLSGLTKGFLSEGDFSAHGIDVSEIRDAAQS